MTKLSETREEFEARYDHGDKSWVGHRASIECYCDYEECTGWGMVPLSQLTDRPMHYNTDEERASALAHHEELLGGPNPPCPYRADHNEEWSAL